MLSEAQIKRVWEGMLGSEIRALYFAERVERLNRSQRMITWATLFMSSGAVATVSIQLPPEFVILRILFPILTVALSLHSLVAQRQKLAIDASDLHVRWGKLAQDYESLWENVYAELAYVKLQALSDRELEVSKASTGFANEPRVMLKWQEHVVKHRLQVQG